MRPVFLLLLFALLTGCDATDPVSEARVPDGSYVEGVATLPGGETVPFRTEGGGGGGLDRSDYPLFGFGSRLEVPSPTPDEIEVSVRFVQPGSTFPQYGEFETRFWDPDREWIMAEIRITNVPGYQDSRELTPGTFSDSLPIGTVTVGSSDRQWLGGTFDLASYRYADGDSTAIVRVVGRYEIPLNLTQ